MRLGSLTSARRRLLAPESPPTRGLSVVPVEAVQDAGGAHLIGPDGVVRWSYQAPSPGDLPGVDLLREGLSAL